MSDRWQARAQKLEARARRMRVHGARLASLYQNAVSKRAAALPTRRVDRKPIDS